MLKKKKQFGKTNMFLRENGGNRATEITNLNEG